jgi:endonuclease YncB( thermonuclease family)
MGGGGSGNGGRRLQRPVAAVVLAVLAAPAAAAENSGKPAQAACELEMLGSGTVASVADGVTFVLADGRQVRLAAIDVPPQPGLDPADPRAKAALAAKAGLSELLLGKPVVLHGPNPQPDRYGRIVADAFVARDGAERSVAQDMLARGFGRLGLGTQDRSCLAPLLALERSARRAKLGLWADPYYDLRRAEDPAGILAERGRFTLVEGKVLSVRESGATIYVNFGRRWTQDFTVTIAKRHERSFAAAGVEPKKLEGRRVMVRGWVEERGGPWIEATRPEQIEIAE